MSFHSRPSRLRCSAIDISDPGDQTIVLVRSDSIGTVVAAYGIVTTVSAWLPWVALALLIAGVLVARQRRRTILNAGVATVVIMAVLLAVIGIGRAVGIGILASTGSLVTPAAAGSVFDQVTQPLTQRVLALGMLALVFAIVAWFIGTSRSAHAARRAGDRVASAVRPRGADTGEESSFARFGSGIDRWHRWILVVVALAAAAVVLLVQPLTAWLVLWTALAALLVVIAIELLRRPARD